MTIKMSMPRKIKNALNRISPKLGLRCWQIWDGLQPIVRGRCSFRNSIRYAARGLCPGLRGRFNYYDTTVYFPNTSAIFRIYCEKGAWEPEVISCLCRLATPGKMFIDVGANIGLSAIAVLREVPGSRALSLEPSPNSVPYLQKTWGISDLRNRWEIVPKAAAECPGSVEFFAADPVYGMWDGLKDTGLAGERHSVEVIQTTVDAEWQRLGCPPVSCVKIDVEGAETKVLKGMEELVRREKPAILLEWARVNLIPYQTDPEYLLHYAKSHGYEVAAFPSLEPVLGIQDLENQMLRAEMFLLNSHARTA
jgi:FkbM family methyltransferase